jgi:hypothetical protein
MFCWGSGFVECKIASLRLHKICCCMLCQGSTLKMEVIRSFSMLVTTCEACSISKVPYPVTFVLNVLFFGRW